MFASHSFGAENVDLKLVLATDVSGSINDEELRLEREGMADALLDADVIRAVQSGTYKRIAVSLVDFGTSGISKVVIPWRIIADRTTANVLAEEIRKLPRPPSRRTSISDALKVSAALFEASETDIISARKIIDVSGDGPNNDGEKVAPKRDAAVAKGVVINGLAIMDDNANGYYPDLDKYYARCVAGGPGSFVVIVRDYRDYRAAMRHKLALEMLGEAQAQPATAQTPEVMMSIDGSLESCDLLTTFGFTPSQR